MSAAAYTALAQSYDALMRRDAQYPRRAAFADRAFRRRSIPVKTVLDLGCGAGTVSWLLARRGYRVLAADASEEMLSAAAVQTGHRIPGPPPLFLRQSMPALDLGGERVDGAVSTLDALNYLLRERDLRETFRRVCRCLRPGGLFLFDVNTPHKLRRMDGQISMDETEDCFCVWRTFYAPRKHVCTWQVDLFHRRGNGTWERTFEEHRERAWDAAELRRLLLNAGFSRVRVTGDLSRRPPAPDADRWLVWAEKDERKRPVSARETGLEP